MNRAPDRYPALILATAVLVAGAVIALDQAGALRLDWNWGLALTMVVAHELGHVLGLAHETRRCALMNPTLLNLSPSRCRPGPLEPWRWRCRILEPDDVRGAVRIYGGRVRRRGRPVCDVFGPPYPPGSLTATPDGLGGLVVGFVRPPTRTPPAFLPVPADSYAVAYRRDTCPSALDQSESFPVEDEWAVPEGGTQQATLRPAASGRYCIAAWSRDGVGRFSRLPATTFVDLP